MHGFGLAIARAGEQSALSTKIHPDKMRFRFPPSAFRFNFIACP
jgi:hypothetical protein